MSRMMRAAVFHGAQDVRVEDVSVPVPGPDELLVEVTAAGICGTDAHEYHSGPHMFPGTQGHPVSGQALPMIIGHEFAGQVVECGSQVSGFSVGELVVSGAGVSCGECVRCRLHQTNLCESYWTVGLQRNGGLAQYVAVPASVCFSAAPFGLSSDLAGIAQPMSIAVHATSRGRVTERDQAIILGAGGIGAFLVHAVAGRTETIGVIDLDPSRLEIAEKNGATFTRSVGSGFSVSELKREWGIRPTVVFEVSGTEMGLKSAWEWLEPGGRLVAVGIQAGNTQVDFRTLSISEHEVIGTNAHQASQDMPRALELLSSGGAWADIAPDILPLDDIVTQGLDPLVNRSSERIKTLFDPRATSARPTDMSLSGSVVEPAAGGWVH